MQDKFLKLRCNFNKIRNRCYYRIIKSCTPMLKASDDILKHEGIKNDELKNYILKCKTLNQVLILDTHLDNYNQIINLYNKHISFLDNCTSQPSSCKEDSENLISKYEKSVFKIEKCIKKRNQYKSTLKQLKLMLKDLKDKSNIFFKFGFDKNSNLICSLIDYNRIFNNIISKGPLTMYVIYGFKDSKGKYDNTSLFLNFENNFDDTSQLKIPDFSCCNYNARCGHGSFALKSLDELVPIINKKILQYNNNFEYKIGIIKSVYGDIVPGGDSTYNGLVKFYKKNGYLKDGKLLKYFD